MMIILSFYFYELLRCAYDHGSRWLLLKGGRMTTTPVQASDDRSNTEFQSSAPQDASDVSRQWVRHLEQDQIQARTQNDNSDLEPTASSNVIATQDAKPSSGKFSERSINHGAMHASRPDDDTDCEDSGVVEVDGPSIELEEIPEVKVTSSAPTSIADTSYESKDVSSEDKDCRPGSTNREVDEHPKDNTDFKGRYVDEAQTLYLPRIKVDDDAIGEHPEDNIDFKGLFVAKALTLYPPGIKVDQEAHSTFHENNQDFPKKDISEKVYSALLDTLSSTRGASGYNGDDDFHDEEQSSQHASKNPGEGSPNLFKDEYVFRDLKRKRKVEKLDVPRSLEASFIREIARVCSKGGLDTHSVSYWPFPNRHGDNGKKIIVVEGPNIESVKGELEGLVERLNFSQYYEIGISNIAPQYVTADGYPVYTIPLIRGQLPHHLDRNTYCKTYCVLKRDKGIAGTVDTYVTDGERIFGVTAAHCFATEQDKKRGITGLASDEDMEEFSLVIGGRAIQTHHITSTSNNEKSFRIRQAPLSLYREFVSVPERVTSEEDEMLQDPIEVEEALMANDGLYLDISIIPFDMRDFEKLRQSECDLQSHVSSSTPHSEPVTTEIGSILDIKGQLRYLIDERICVYVDEVAGHVIEQRLPATKNGRRMGVHFTFTTEKRLKPGASGSGIRVFDDRQKKFFLIGILCGSHPYNQHHPLEMYIGIPLKLALDKFQQVYPGHVESGLDQLYRSERSRVQDLRHPPKKKPMPGDDLIWRPPHGREEPGSGDNVEESQVRREEELGSSGDVEESQARGGEEPGSGDSRERSQARGGEEPGSGDNRERSQARGGEELGSSGDVEESQAHGGEKPGSGDNVEESQARGGEEPGSGDNRERSQPREGEEPGFGDNVEESQANGREELEYGDDRKRSQPRDGEDPESGYGTRDGE